MRQVIRFAVIAAALSLTSACATRQKDSPAAASDIARSSLCLIDRKIPLRPAPEAGAADPGNRFDSDETTDALAEHNARFDAACPPA